MSVPAQQEQRHVSAKWETIGSALETWGKTLRLCLILFVASIPAIIGLVSLAMRAPW